MLKLIAQHNGTHKHRGRDRQTYYASSKLEPAKVIYCYMGVDKWQKTVHRIGKTVSRRHVGRQTANAAMPCEATLNVPAMCQAVDPAGLKSTTEMVTICKGASC